MGLLMLEFLKSKWKQLFCQHKFEIAFEADADLAKQKVKALRYECSTCKKDKIELKFLD